jgi:phage baseplate assembly protein W
MCARFSQFLSRIKLNNKMARNTRIFSDLDLNFTAHPVTKDITRRYDENSIKTSLKNLILTSNYERPFHSEIGSPIKRLLFEPATPMLENMVQRAIVDVVNNFEPRVRLIDVVVNLSPDTNSLYVSIEFTIVNTESPLTLDLVLERTR